MKDKTKLISSLRTAAKALTQDKLNYNWYYNESCNCGVVAQCLLNKPECEIYDLLSPNLKEENSEKNKTWSKIVKETCTLTGLSTCSIIKELIENGFERDDFLHLEYLSNPEIQKRAGIKTTKTVTKKYGFLNLKERMEVVEDSDFFTYKSNLIKYLYVWADILEEKNLDKKEDEIILPPNLERIACQLMA